MSFSQKEPQEVQAEQKELPENIKQLLRILTFRRPHASDSEKQFIDEFIIPLGVAEIGELDKGVCAAFVKKIPNKDGTDSRTIFSCHTDTVHHNYKPYKPQYGGYQGNVDHLYSDGAGGYSAWWDKLTGEDNVIDQREKFPTAVPEPESEIKFKVFQEVFYDTVKNVAYKNDDECLGADDGAGVWVMLQMIAAGVPGAYMFHRGEERGGQGSRYIKEHYAEELKAYDRAIAFDRKATFSVITWQGGGRCCSDDFAWTIAGYLSTLMPDDVWAADDTGVFTDTANYTTLIPECTNLSVGYYNEHGKNEYLDVRFVAELAAALCQVEWEALPTVRDRGIPKGYKHNVTEINVKGAKKSNKRKYVSKRTDFSTMREISSEDFLKLTDGEVGELTWDNPELATEMLLAMRTVIVDSMTK